MPKQLGTTTQGVYQFGMVHSSLKAVLVIWNSLYSFIQSRAEQISKKQTDLT